MIIKNERYKDEVIFDMNKRTFNIKDKNGVIHTLVSDFEGELYPHVMVVVGYCKLLKS